MNTNSHGERIMFGFLKNPFKRNCNYEKWKDAGLLEYPDIDFQLEGFQRLNKYVEDNKSNDNYTLLFLSTGKVITVTDTHVLEYKDGVVSVCDAEEGDVDCMFKLMHVVCAERFFH